MAFLHFIERLFWVSLLAFIGAVTAPQLFKWNIDVIQAAEVAAMTAGIRELVAFGMSRLAMLPEPGTVPTPIVTRIVKGSGS